MKEDYELSNIVKDLLETKREDDWWDFKLCHHNNTVPLLHDIICLANNRSNRDAYLIFGVEDTTWNIIGVENDSNRRNQQNIVQLLKPCHFAGDTRPRVEVRTVIIATHEIDVFIIKNSTDVPYYLTKDYCDKNKKDYRVRAYHIYTRVMDNNTDIDKSADLRDVEYLWKKRFGLIQTPLEHIKVLLSNPEDWEYEEDRYYHKQFPQYTFVLEDDDKDDRRRSLFFHHLHSFSSYWYNLLRVFHYSTQMYSCLVTGLDNSVLTVPCPDSEFLSGHNRYGFSDCIYYYTRDSLKFRFLRFFFIEDNKRDSLAAPYVMDRHLSVVLLFDDKNEVIFFREYVEKNRDKLDEIMEKQEDPHVAAENDKASEIAAYEIKTCMALKEMQALFMEER